MSQLKNKFIEDNAVTGTKIRLANNENLRARNNANTADVNILKLNSSDKPAFQTLPEVDSSLSVPSSDKQLATVEYVNNVVAAKGDVKDAVNVLADTNVPLTGSTPLVIDGVTVASGYRVGLTGQTTASQNGIYTMAIVSSTYTLSRSSDANTNAQVTEGMNFLVVEGTVYSGYEVLLTTPDPIVLGTTSLTFARYPSTLSLVGGDMITKSNNTFSVDLATLAGLESTNPGNAAGQLRIKADTASLEKDQGIRIDPTSGFIAAKKPKKQTFTLSSTDISNQYVDLSNVASQDSVQFCPAGAGEQIESTDFSVNYTGGASSKTRVTFLGGLATGGVSALAAGDVVSVKYESF